MDKITTSACTVIYPGELSAGLRECQWRIDGDMIFKDKEALEEFRKSLSASFDLVTGGGHYIVFDHEWPKDPEDFEEFHRDKTNAAQHNIL